MVRKRGYLGEGVLQVPTLLGRSAKIGANGPNLLEESLVLALKVNMELNILGSLLSGRGGSGSRGGGSGSSCRSSWLVDAQIDIVAML